MFIVVSLSLILWVTLTAARPDFYEFISVKGATGVNMSGITALTVDGNGFVWGASRMGVLRATPTDVRIYDLPMSASDVMQMKLSYNRGVLIAATQNGKVFQYNRIKDCFDKYFSISDSLGKTDWISNIVVDKMGNVWISTSLGIFNLSDNHLKRGGSKNSGYSYILPLGENEMFAIEDGNIYKYNQNGKLISHLPGKFEKFISSAVYDPFRNRVIIGTYKGELWEYNLNGKSLSLLVSDAMPELIIRSILVSDKDTILVGMEGGGIIVLNAEDGKVVDIVKDDIDDPGSLKGNSVFAMTSDPQGRLWVATTSGGLQFTDADGEDIGRIVHRYNSNSSLHNNEINFLLTDEDGNLWVATNDGISRRDNRDGSWRQLYGGRQLSVLSLVQDKRGRLYASTYGNGVYVVDPSTCNQLDHFTGKDADIFGKGSYVFASLLDSEGDVWFGGVKGDVVCYSPESGQFRKYESHPVFCFAEEKPGVILTGGGDGLISIDKESGEANALLSDNVVQQILVNGKEWWICTSGNGVICMDRSIGSKDYKTLTVNNGLHSNFTRSIVRNGGKLWIGTALGMSCYDLDKNVMLKLPGKDILTNDAFRENSACVLPDGNLAFGTNNGIVFFNPEKIIATKGQGKIFFSDIKVSGRSIRTDFDVDLTVPIDSIRELELNYPRNSFTLSMQALGNVGSNVMYSWRLDGIDKEWTEPSSLSSINYINLDPGLYSLTIRMYDGGIVSERMLTIRVNPPFWNSIWFRIVVLIAVLAFTVLIVRHNMLSIRRKHAFEKLLLSLQIAENAKDQSTTESAEADTYDNSASVSADLGCDSCGNEARDRVGDLSDKITGHTEKKVIEDAFLAKAMECVRENMSNESFGKGDFASEMMISQSLLYKKIKAATDMSVVEFIRSIRLNHAMTLLTSGNHNVTEVSEMCGFSSSAYFSRVFKENFGKSPSEILLQKS